MAKGFFGKDFQEIFFSQAVSVFGGLLAGIALAVYTDKLLLIPGLFIVLPGFLELRGNISGSLASRLSSGLYLKVIKPDNFKSKIVKGNVIASFLMALIASFFLGLIAFAFNYLVLNAFAPKLILIFLLAGILANLAEIPLTLFVTFYLFKKGHDPNNIIGPFVTSTGDITSIISLVVVLVLI